MSSLKLAGAAGALDNINATQEQFRDQIAAINDLVRQIGGDANIEAGSTAPANPLTAPFTLYVNPYIGNDTFAAGSYNSYEAPSGSTDEETIDAKIRRLEKQRLTCGYTQNRPFKTINRAVIEAAIITSKNYWTFTDPKAHLDCVSILLAPAAHTVYNDPGSGTPQTWVDGYEPSVEELIKFNPAEGGVLLPRGCSLFSPDLRKCSLRPNWIPPNEDELADSSNRRQILKITGTGYFFGFSFFDKINATTSHHLLSPYGFASEPELDAFYTKVRTYVGSPANISNALAVTRETEYKIVGPIEGTPSAAWDTTASASPYVFNCSVRSEYGMGGIHANGSKVEGLKSMVCASFTGVSLQKDMSCWQLYSNGSWIEMPDYATYISSDPNNVRMNPARRSIHIDAINDAFIQQVSIFAIGQGLHHRAKDGGETSITNSNSSFGGCVALSEGYKSAAFDLDKEWRFAYFKAPLNISEKTGNVQKYYLGTVGEYADGSTTITLTQDLLAAAGSTTVPKILGDEGYSLRANSYIWVENPNGTDWRAQLATVAWDSSTPNKIRLIPADPLASPPSDGSPLADGNNVRPGIPPTGTVNRAVGRRVYIRRLLDTRTASERRLSVGMFATVASTRIVQRDYILQLDPTAPVLVGDVDPYVNGTLPTSDPIAVTTVAQADITASDYPQFSNIYKGMEVQLRRTNPDLTYTASTFYREGTVVKYQGKHFTSVRDLTTPSTGGPSSVDWQESFVHMESDFNADEKINNQSYAITFDNDTESLQTSTTLGFDFSTIWTSSSSDPVVQSVQNQYRSSNDYQGAYSLLRALGFSVAASHAALQPRITADRIRKTNSTTDFPTAPSGGLATTRNAWAAEFRRPSVIRLFAHAFEWAGTLNYTKGLPSVQRELSPLNKFSYYFTNKLGGRVYPSGFNEEGFAVKSTGIEDLNTGQSQSLTALATSEEDPLTEFPNGISAQGTSIFNDIEITGNAKFVTSANLSNAASPLGPVSLATIADIQGTGININDFSDFNILDGNLPKVITNLSLQYWSQYNSLLSGKVFSLEVGTDPNEVPISGMLGRLAFVDEWCGYAQGGGSVTQATSKATAVTLNRPCGQITLNNAALAGDTSVSFTLNNTQIGPQDVVAASIKSGATAGAYAVSTLDIASGSVKIVLRNLTSGSLSEAVVLNVVIIKSTTTA